VPRQLSVLHLFVSDDILPMADLGRPSQPRGLNYFVYTSAKPIYDKIETIAVVIRVAGSRECEQSCGPVGEL
jgi:hypothetical protein